MRHIYPQETALPSNKLDGLKTVICMWLLQDLEG